MHCVDVNVLLDSVISTAPNHNVARETLERLRRSPGSPRGFGAAYFGERFDRAPLLAPMVEPRVLNPGPAHWSIFRGLLDTNRPRAHDITDVWLAAAALEINATWVSFDRGFNRFKHLRWLDPAA